MPPQINKLPVLLSKFLLLMMMQWPKLGKSRLYLKLRAGLASTATLSEEEEPDLGSKEQNVHVKWRH